MTSVVEFKTKKENTMDTVFTTAMEQKFESAMIVGIKDGNVYLIRTPADSVLQELGATVALQDYILRQWNA